jgi:Putative restriction endonuclease
LINQGFVFNDLQVIAKAFVYSIEPCSKTCRKFIGNPKQPTISIYHLVNEEYQVAQFRNSERIISPTFPDLNLTANQIFNGAL